MKARTRRRAAPERVTVCVRRALDFPVVTAREALAPGRPELLEILRRREPLARHRVLFVIDRGAAAKRRGLVEAAAAYAAAHPGSLIAAGAPLVAAGGEEAKTRRELGEWLRARMAAAAIGARSHVVVVGGGALIDAAGFAAATLHGGARVTRLPTTLAAQASGAAWTDCALNAGGRPDLIRAWQTPFGVVLDPTLTAGEPRRQKRAALAEACCAALGEDAQLFRWMASRAARLQALERAWLEEAALRSATLGWRAACRGVDARLGRFGRWCAYALFARAGGDLLFGEACAIGAAVDLLLSAVLAGLDPGQARAGLQTLAALGLPLWHPALAETEEDGTPCVMRALLEAGEREGRPYAVPLLRRLGAAEPFRAPSAEAVAAAVEALQRWSDL